MSSVPRVAEGQSRIPGRLRGFSCWSIRRGPAGPSPRHRLQGLGSAGAKRGLARVVRGGHRVALEKAWLPLVATPHGCPGSPASPPQLQGGCPDFRATARTEYRSWVQRALPLATHTHMSVRKENQHRPCKALWGGSWATLCLPLAGLARACFSQFCDIFSSN